MILALLLAAQAGGFTERTLGKIPEGARLGEVLVTPDGTVAAYALTLGGKSYVVRGDWRTPEADLASPVALSGDGRHALVMSVHARDGGQLRLDDRLMRSFDRGTGETWRSPGALNGDGSVAVFLVGQPKNQWTYSVNGKNGTFHTLSHLDVPQISLDGKTIAGWGATLDHLYRVIVNDVAGPIYDEVVGPVVSDLGVVAYVGAKPDGTLTLHHADRASGLKGLLPSDLFISADGTKLGYVRFEGGRMVVTVGAKAFPPLKGIRRARFDGRGERVAYWGYDDQQKLFAGVDDRLFASPGIVTAPVFSPDGSKLGYGAQVGTELRWKVIDLDQ